MLQNMTRIFRANDKPEQTTKYTETPISYAITPRISVTRNAVLDVSLSRAHMVKLGWKIGDRVSLKGNAREGVILSLTKRNRRRVTFKIGYGHDARLQISGHHVGVALGVQASKRAVDASIEGGNLYIKPLAEIFYTPKVVNNAAAPTACAPQEKIEQKVATAVGADATSFLNTRATREDARAARILFNETMKAASLKPVKVFIDEKGEIQVSVAEIADL